MLEIPVVIASLNSEGSSVSEQIHRLARAFFARIHKEGVQIKAQSKI